MNSPKKTKLIQPTKKPRFLLLSSAVIARQAGFASKGIEYLKKMLASSMNHREKLADCCAKRDRSCMSANNTLARIILYMDRLGLWIRSKCNRTLQRKMAAMMPDNPIKGVLKVSKVESVHLRHWPLT